MQRALNETPGIVKLCLDGDMALELLFLILQLQNLEKINKRL